ASRPQGARAIAQEEKPRRSRRAHSIQSRIRLQIDAEVARVILVDTSVWVEVLRDRAGRWRMALEGALEGDDAVLARFHQLELLQGARDEREWSLLEEYLDSQIYLECDPDSWINAARTYFDLRRVGKTIRSPIHFCIAQI